MDNILNKALIIQPGAIGDCILTLPLAKFLKEKLGLMIVDFLSHKDYSDYLSLKSDIDTHSAQITTLQLKRPADSPLHVNQFYIQQYIKSNQINCKYECYLSDILLNFGKTSKKK